jgi:hypothetical protein
VGGAILVKKRLRRIRRYAGENYVGDGYRDVVWLLRVVNRLRKKRRKKR